MTWGEQVGRRAPNLLTYFRILVIPVFVYLLVDPTPQRNLIALFIFVLASVTDWFDGFLARLYQAESILGSMLDPLADKILVTAALVMLAATPTEPRVPAWMVVILLSRELIVTGLRSVAAVKGMVVPASRSGKHKTGWTFLAIACLLVYDPYRMFGMTVDFHSAGMLFLWIALVLSVVSGVIYGVQLRKLFEEE